MYMIIFRLESARSKSGKGFYGGATVGVGRSVAGGFVGGGWVGGGWVGGGFVGGGGGGGVSVGRSGWRPAPGFLVGVAVAGGCRVIGGLVGVGVIVSVGVGVGVRGASEHSSGPVCPPLYFSKTSISAEPVS
jgi:hypothetical protein